MIIEEICSEERIILDEAQLVWARSGSKVVKKYRCTSGLRKGRVVASPAQCAAPINIGKRVAFKKLKAKMGGKMARKAKKTKRTNPASRRIKSMNKSRK